MFSVCQLGFKLFQFCEPARSKLVEEQIFARNSRWVPLSNVVIYVIWLSNLAKKNRSCKLKIVITFLEFKGYQRSNTVTFALWLLGKKNAPGHAANILYAHALKISLHEINWKYGSKKIAFWQIINVTHECKRSYCFGKLLTISLFQISSHAEVMVTRYEIQNICE